MKIIKEISSVLLNRKRISIELSHEHKPTPKNKDLKKEISSFLNVPEDLIEIRHIYTKYGAPNSKVIVHTYKTKEDLDKIEFKKKKIKKKKEKTQKKQEAK